MVTDFILGQLKQKHSNYKEIIYHHCQAVLPYLEQVQRKQQCFNVQPDSDFSIMVRFNKMIIDQIHQFHYIDFFAKSLQLSTKKLTQLSKTILHNNPAQVIKQTKVLEAKRNLSNTRISIKELVHLLGFEQATYFTKYFKKETGLTPKEFRQLHL